MTEIFDVPEVSHSSRALSSLKMLHVCVLYLHVEIIHFLKMRFYIFIGVNLWHFSVRSFIFVLIFSFRKSVMIALAYLEKISSGEECISVRLGLSLKKSQI